MDTLPRPPILVISPDWQTRALLAAQLGEVTGRSVIPAPGAREALGLLRTAAVDPILVIADTGQRIGPEEIGALIEALTGTPLILVTSALHRADFASLAQRCAAHLTRPVSIGANTNTAEEVLRALHAPRAGPEPQTEA